MASNITAYVLLLSSVRALAFERLITVLKASSTLQLPMRTGYWNVITCHTFNRASYLAVTTSSNPRNNHIGDDDGNPYKGEVGKHTNIVADVGDHATNQIPTTSHRDRADSRTLKNKLSPLQKYGVAFKPASVGNSHCLNFNKLRTKKITS
ncbi:hypothetical protein V8F33_006499 [Rhypophila sp. PSN 637]